MSQQIQTSLQPTQEYQEPKPIIDVKSPIHTINCSDEFEQLTDKEKMYSYYFYKAAWEGAKICYFQKSFEAPALHIIILLTFQQDLEQLKKEALNTNITEEEYQKILVFCSAVLNNCGNYKSFGDTKFVPDVSEETFYKFLTVSNNFKNPYYKKIINELWADIKLEVFKYDGLYKNIGYPITNGLTGYYSSQMSKEEIELVDELLQILNVNALNTRILKLQENVYQVLIASANFQKGSEHTYKNKTVKITYGDYHSIIARVATNLQKAIPFAANDHQVKMLKAYVSHFLSGDVELHKESQREWVQDKGPVIETNIGFIETYLDPKQVRAEFEGFVSVVHKKNSERLNSLVENAEKLLKKMPWPKEFELEKFLKPDFTSLSILAFASSGTPLGINIPNYDDIRQVLGFKNVYLSNVMMKLKNILFMLQDDAALLEKWSSQVWFQKVSYHELLGHGCGKLFTETLEKGKNFDENIINPLTKQKITSWYKPGEIWSSKFGPLSNNYEECRADSVALYFCTFKEGTQILLPEFVENFEELMYVSWLEVVYSGIKALEFYVAEKQVWGQAHMNGRFVILQVLLEAGNNLVKIEKTKDNDGKDNLLISVDKTKIQTVGKEAMAKFLLKMQVYKSTADLEEAKKMYDNYSKVDDYFMDVRRIVLERRQPRRLEVQGHLELKGSLPVYQGFKESFEGIIESYVTRYSQFDSEMLSQYQEYKNLFKNQEVATQKL